MNRYEELPPLTPMSTSRLTKIATIFVCEEADAFKRVGQELFDHIAWQRDEIIRLKARIEMANEKLQAAIEALKEHDNE